MGFEKATLNKYRIKEQFKELFENLATGKTYVAHDAFKDHKGAPQRKGLTSIDESNQAAQEELLMEKLVEEGFVERILVSTDILTKR